KIGGSLGQMVSGAKKSFASLGASIGNAIAMIPGIGTVAGTAISALGGLIGGLFGKKEKKTEEQRQAEEMEMMVDDISKAMSKFGEVSESTAKKIAEADKTMSGFAAVSKYFGDVIRDVGVTQENVNDLWSRASQIVGNWKKGHLSASDATNALNDSFKELLKGTQELGEEGSAAMVKFILKVRNSGLEVKAVTDYVVGQLDRIPEALEGLLAPAVKAGESLDILKEKLAEQNKELEGLEEGSKEYKKLQEEIKRTKTGIEEATIAYEEHKAEVERAGILALTTFNAMREEGVSYYDAVQKMKDPLIALRSQYDALGLDANKALDKLFGVIDVTEANKELFEAIDANKTIMEALGNTGHLTDELINGFATDAISNYEKLKEKFGNSDQALRAMGPTLQKIQDYAAAYNITLDEGTQNLIDQATQIGAVKETQKSAIEEQKEMFKGLGDRMEKIMGGVGDTIEKCFKTAFGDAFKEAKKKADDAAGSIDKTFRKFKPVIDIGFNYPAPSINLGTNARGRQGGPAFAGGFQAGGVIEAGPYRPTAFVFGEGSQRERAIIQHVGAGGGREIGAKVEVNINGPLISTTGISRADLERVGDELFQIIKYQARRAGGEI
ncbi:MAG: hypothetical protein ACTSPV_00355, partial [Candidatus Hodarchaeales archaeon]